MLTKSSHVLPGLAAASVQRILYGCFKIVLKAVKCVRLVSDTGPYHYYAYYYSLPVDNREARSLRRVSFSDVIGSNDSRSRRKSSLVTSSMKEGSASFQNERGGKTMELGISLHEAQIRSILLLVLSVSRIKKLRRYNEVNQ